MDFKVDFRDLKFQLLEWLPLDRVLSSERFADWDRESLDLVLDEALTLASSEFAPANEDGDRLGVQWEAGKVTTPASFKKAYAALSEGGWVGCVANPVHGGLGLPFSVATLINDLFAGANMAFTLQTLLSRGVLELIEHHGTAELKALFCERLVSGEWSGTMCLTEPQAGSDVGASTSVARAQEDGRYLISGQKIFITSGEHDLTANIVHAVLARTPDAAPGTRGLSLFAVPRIRVAADGSLGASNDVYCAGIEHKMGIHGSPTCTLVFGGNGECEGYILGAEGDGMRLMFEMMNGARIEVGSQAAAVAGAAHQSALSYARERVQMRHWDRTAPSGNEKVAIIEHPDVRRTLLIASAYVQAMRALLLQTALFKDMATISSGEERARFEGLVQFLTPICKAWCSDWAFRVTEWSLQVYGGYGYTSDYPAEQYMRDCKITSIYEGTNGIQALDFVGRKLPLEAALEELLSAVTTTVEKALQDLWLEGSAKLLRDALEVLQETLGDVGKSESRAMVTVLNAVPVLEMFGTLLGGHFLLSQALIARRRLDELTAGEATYDQVVKERSSAAFYHDKVQAAIHFCYRALPSIAALSVAIRAEESAPIDALLSS